MHKNNRIESERTLQNREKENTFCVRGRSEGFHDRIEGEDYCEREEEEDMNIYV